jgi:hypothetical protein
MMMTVNEMAKKVALREGFIDSVPLWIVERIGRGIMRLMLIYSKSKLHERVQQIKRRREYYSTGG